MKYNSTIPALVLLLLISTSGLEVVCDLQAQATKSPPGLSPLILQRIDAAVPSAASTKPTQPRRILVFWRCEGFLHAEGIAAANHALEQMGLKTGAYVTDFADDYAVFESAKLAHYDALVLNNTTQLRVPNSGKKALMDFIHGGKGLVGIHAATDCFYDWREAAAMLGGLFDGHPWGAGGTWAFKLDDPEHRLNAAWGGKGFKLKDEIYQFKAPYTRSDRRVLVSLDLSDPTTGAVRDGVKRADKDFAVAWVKTCGNGRVFYCSLGHAANVFQNPQVLRFYLDGVQFALGDLEADTVPPKEDSGS